MAKARPSDARRKALADQITIPDVSSFFPLERYYDVAEKLYQSLNQTFATKDDLDLCYVYGKRYCMFCMEAIPAHNYYGTTKYKALQNKHTAQIQKVVSILEEVATAMDRQEISRAKEALQKKREQYKRDQEMLEQWQQRIWAPSKPAISIATNVEESAMDKLKLLQQKQHQSNNASASSSSTRYRFVEDSSDTDDDNYNSNTAAAVSLNGITPLLPPPLLPPPTDIEETTATPPSYDAVVQSSQKYHSFFGSEQIPIPKEPPLVSQKRLSVRQLRDLYQNMYNKYQSSGKIQVLPIDTYQGRVSDSTNGCTVISALIAARHLNDVRHIHITISNEIVKQIMDVQCGPILRDIRRKLGLSGHALIIPSDVHDHLVDHKILHQEYFLGAAGGNVLDPNHYGEFLRLISSPATATTTAATKNDSTKTSNGKAAATLFFREHVISIVKFTETNGRVYYDWIDSMPGFVSKTTGQGMATRTRCTDPNALQVLLQWYASRKFSDSNCTYIDGNPWDDSMADLDPRVFQGFVWST